MSLFHIQDSDRPMWVVAGDWQSALDQWKHRIAAENDGDDAEPEGIQYVCDDDDLIVRGDYQGDPEMPDIGTIRDNLRARVENDITPRA